MKRRTYEFYEVRTADEDNAGFSHMLFRGTHDRCTQYVDEKFRQAKSAGSELQATLYIFRVQLVEKVGPENG